MAVYDRWHKDPQPGDEPCRCGRGRNKLYPSSDHQRGDRWQVRWRDPSTGRQRKRNFALRDGASPNEHADAFDAKIAGQIVARTYTDPRAGEVSLREYAETWRRTRTHSEESARALAARLRNHVYEGEPGSGRTPKGAVSIGQHPMALLALRPTLAAAWVASLAVPLPAQGSRMLVVGDVTAVFAAAVEDGIVGRNPMKSPAVDRPGRGGAKARPFSAAEVDAIAAQLPPRLQVLPRLGAGAGPRAMELAALGTGDVQFLGKRPRIRVERQLRSTGGQLVFAPLKNRKPHDVPLAPSVADALARHLEVFPAAEVTLPWHEPGSRMHGKPHTVRLVLTGEGGKPLTRTALQQAWNTAAAKAAGALERNGYGHLRVTGRNMHRLRHTYASAQLRAGVDVVRVAAWLGDTVDTVVKTYAHLMPDDDEADGRAAVDGFFRPCAPDVPSQGAEGTSSQAGGS